MEAPEVGPARDEAALDLIVDALRSARTVVLSGHVHPDADSLGSTLGIGLALRELGLDVQVSYPGSGNNAGGSGLPDSLSWLPGVELLVGADALTVDADAAISCDVSSPDRLGELLPIMRGAHLFAAIDHHQSYAGFAQVAYIDATAPANTMLALDLVDRLGVELTIDMATCFYAGLSADTGSFRWAATNAVAHEVAARLHRVGIRHDEIARFLYEERPFAEWQMVGAALGRAILEPTAVDGLGLAWTAVSSEDRTAMGLAEQSAQVIVDALRLTAEAEVVAVVKESDDQSWRVSVRSKGRVDVGAACLSLGGGGHRCAGGYTVTHTEPHESSSHKSLISSAISQLRDALRRAPVIGVDG